MPPVAAARVVDLSNLTAINSFFIQGGAAADEAGFSVSSAGDVKGDGISDLIIGAPGNDCAAISADAAYVIYGVAGSTHDRVDLSALDPSDGFTLFGDTTGDYASWNLSSAGDANGDGIDDLIIGAFSGDICGIDACEAYVVYGVPTSARGPVDLFNLNSIFGFTIQGDVPNDIAGLSVSGAGDANGDGCDDLIIGARGGDDGGSNAGEAYVIYRVTGTTRATVDLTGLAASDGFIIRGDAAEDLAGFSVSGADDVNGDGIADLIVGAPYGDNGDDYAGEAYVIYGKAGTPRGTVDLTGLAASDGFIIQGDAAGDSAGFNVSGAGDVNGDGVDDLIVGANRGNNAGTNAGEAYVILGGSASGFGAVVDLTTLAAPYGFIIQGDDAYDTAGWSVSSAGDVNGDRLDDLIVGSPVSKDSGNSVGEATVIYGKAGATRGTLDLTGLAASDGFIIEGDAAYDIAGWSVSSAGDVNGDGIDDLIVGARLRDDGGYSASEAYLIFGVAGATRGTLDLTGLIASEGFIIQGDEEGDGAGWSVSSAGDLNGDDIDDLIVGARGGDDGGAEAGEAYAIYGVAGVTRGTVDLTGLAASDVFIIQGDAAYDQVGFSVSSAGDVNGDGIDDLIVGAPYGDDGGTEAGEAYVIYGRRPTIEVTRTGTGISQAIFGGHLNDTINGMGGNDLLDGDDGADSLDGGAGIDTADCSRAAVTVTVSLLTGTGTQGEAAGDVFAGIERLAGSAFADNLTGNTGVNLLRGGAGADTMDGGAGTDTFDYRTAASGIRVDLFAGTGSLGDAAGDVVSGFEVVFGSAFDDTVTGNASANRIRRSARADIIDGGAGSDTLDYVTSGAAVTVNLLTGTGLFGDAEGDMISGIERVIGSRFDDVLTGNALRNFLGGGAGDDVMNGGGGNDVFLFGAGDDSINGDDGIDVAPFIGNQSEFTMFDFAPGNWTSPRPALAIPTP